MCIIVVKPAGIELPSEKTLKNCFISNPDGSGIAYTDEGTVKISKGFMTFADFKDGLEAIDNPTEKAMILHFRIATHGAVMGATCHPFPLSSKESELKRLETSCDIIAAHNGTISGMRTSKQISDTMAYIRDVIAPLKKMSGHLMFNDDAMGVIEATIGSKLALLDYKGNIRTIGNFIENDGLLYSNSTYLDSVSSWKSYSRYEAWDDYDYYYKDGEEGCIAMPIGVMYDGCKKCLDYDYCKEAGCVCMDQEEVAEYLLEQDEKYGEIVPVD